MCIVLPQEVGHGGECGILGVPFWASIRSCFFDNDQTGSLDADASFGLAVGIKSCTLALDSMKYTFDLTSLATLDEIVKRQTYP